MTVDTRELEAALRERVDLSVLSVWADALQTEGDPRGEMIAIEIENIGKNPLHYTSFLVWLRAELAQRNGTVGSPHLYVTGEHDRSWLASELGEFARGLSIIAKFDEVRRTLAIVAQRPRPWARTAKALAGFETIVLDEALARAMPNLVELELEGRFDARGFASTSVRKLVRVARSTEGHAELVHPYAMPGVTHVELEIPYWPDKLKKVSPSLVGLPALHSLDVSRCEPEFYKHPGFRSFDAFDWISRVPERRQLRTLRVPSIRTRRDADLVAGLLREVPALTVDIARAYAPRMAGAELGPRVTHPLPYPWTPDNERDPAHWFVKIDLAGHPERAIVTAISGWLESLDYAGLPAQEREAWLLFWIAIDLAKRGKPAQLAFSTLARTLGSMADGPEHNTSTDIGRMIRSYATRVSPDAQCKLSFK